MSSRCLTPPTFLKPSPLLLVTQVFVPCVHDMDGCVAGAGVVCMCSALLFLLGFTCLVSYWCEASRSMCGTLISALLPEKALLCRGHSAVGGCLVETLLSGFQFLQLENVSTLLYRVSCEVFSSTFLGLSYFHRCPWFLVHSLKQFTALSTSWLWCCVNLVFSSSL